MIRKPQIYTKKISEGVKQETELVGWKTKTNSENRLVILFMIFYLKYKMKN
jgi:hypothetical protein